MLAIEMVLVKYQHPNSIGNIKPCRHWRIVRHAPTVAATGPQHLRVVELNAIRDSRAYAPKRGMIAVSSHLDMFSVELHASVSIECDLADPEAQIDAIDRCNTTSNVENRFV